MSKYFREMNFYLILFVAVLMSFLPGCSNVKKEIPHVSIQTTWGEITLELYPESAPLTVENFLTYIDENAYNGATFYRATRPGNDPSISVLQGGLWQPWQKDMIKNYKPAFPSVPHETTESNGLSHTNGVISMGRFDPGTANSEFFISIGENPSLDYGGDRHADGQGFAAFGRVIAGMDIVRAIHALPTETGEGFQAQILIEPVKIEKIRRSPT